MTNTDTTSKYPFTADDIAALRDDQQLSWAKVAERLNGLGSPGAARRAYSALVRPHTESVLPGRTRSGADLTPITLAGLDLDAVRDAIVGKTIVVQRQGDRTEAIPVERVTSLKGDTVNFNDGTKSRSAKTESIVATK